MLDVNQHDYVNSRADSDVHEQYRAGSHKNRPSEQLRGSALNKTQWVQFPPIDALLTGDTMNFTEAMDKLKSGSTVSRQPWKERLYFKIIDNEVKTFQPVINPYLYEESIMISDGWLINDCTDEMTFAEAINHLRLGSKARLKHWENRYIQIDFTSKTLALHSMETFPYLPDFGSFIAEDWVEL